jgi:putative transposase
MPTAAWELVHIDHTPLDEKVWVQSGLEEVLERPHVSIAIDTWSKCVVSFWLSFTAPSSETLLALVRDCVRRHGRLARGWISDHGAEFGSTSWERFCAAHGCTKFERPVGFPRAGSEIENLFGQLNKGLIHQLDGNMRNDQDSRAASSTHKSQATARFTLEQIYSKIESYLFEHYNQTSHGPSLFAPSATLQQSVADLGSLAGIRQAFNYAFRVGTALPSKRQRHIIDSGRGIRIGERAYWHPILGEPSSDRKRVEVRHEPFDSSLIYAHVGGRWLSCIDSRHSKLRFVDEFSRWAQAALDMNGRARARASRRLATEHFVRSLEERQTAEEVERLANQAIPKPANTHAEKATLEDAQAKAPSAFTFLVGRKRPPLREAES